MLTDFDLLCSLFLIATSLLFASYIWRATHPPSIDLYHLRTNDDNDRSLAKLIRNKVPSLSAPNARFRGVWWLPGGNAQTIYCSIGNFSKVDPVIYERKHLQVADGGLLCIDITPPFSSHPKQDGETILLVAHGLTGGSHESYVRAALTTSTAPTTDGGLGMRAVVVNFRGCNNSPVLTPNLYHAGCSQDFRPVVLWICHTFPNSKIFGLGFSLGANVLAKYVGEESSECPLSGLASIANVWDFVRGSYHIEQNSFANKFIYQNALGGALRSLLYLHRHAFLSSPSSPFSAEYLEKVFKAKRITLKQYDTVITAPLYGFKDAMDYYDKISSSKVLEYIRIPTLGINSLDDPIVGVINLPFREVKSNPWVVLAITHGGGHMGWFERNPDGSLGRWYVKPITEFFAALLESDLPPRPKPSISISEDGVVHQVGNSDVSFIERDEKSLDLFVSGTGESKLFTTGW